MVKHALRCLLQNLLGILWDNRSYLGTRHKYQTNHYLKIDFYIKDIQGESKALNHLFSRYVQSPWEHRKNITARLKLIF
jgi:hypothetical protein